MGDYASNGPSAVNSRENTGLGQPSERFALISHSKQGTLPAKRPICCNPPQSPKTSGELQRPHGKSSQTDPSTAKVPHTSPDTITRTSKCQYAPTGTIPRTSPRTLASTSTYQPAPPRAYIDAAVGSESNSARSAAISRCTPSRCCAVL